MPVDTEMRLTDGDHVVQFYGHDDELMDVVTSYLSAAVLDDEAVIVIATPQHRAGFEAALASTGAEPARAAAQGRLVMLDAADTLSRFMADDGPDPAAFDAVVGRLVREAAGAGRGVRAYGEMVAVLWDAGDVAGAIELERLWNSLGEHVPFSLFCAYPSHGMGAAPAEAFAQVCHLHSELVRAAPPPDRSEVTKRFPRASQSSRLARRFVAETLKGWGRGRLVDDGALVVSELVTNALMHARSDFTVGLSRSQDGVRLVVGDASPAPPRPCELSTTSLGGRGLRLVDAIAPRWGHEVVSGGKFVWAELGAEPPLAPAEEGPS